MKGYHERVGDGACEVAEAEGDVVCAEEATVVSGLIWCRRYFRILSYTVAILYTVAISIFSRSEERGGRWSVAIFVDGAVPVVERCLFFWLRL